MDLNLHLSISLAVVSLLVSCYAKSQNENALHHSVMGIFLLASK
jgi:hypothetical protein